MQVFFCPEIELSDTFITLNEEESRHCFRALRLTDGDEVLLTNGKGLKASGRLCGGNMNQAQIELTNTSIISPASPRLSMAVAPTKNHDRYEWFAEKATELGIQQIIPLICRHSERKSIQEQRLRRVMIAAIKQSQTYFLPEIILETKFENLVKQAFSGQKLIAWCGGDAKVHLKDILEKGRDARILIGPEGDFDDNEMALAKTEGYLPISLGKKRLRTETAALAACHIFNLIHES
jgi:16S rRNA (uracil1498-N3)-methyltransferase